MTTTGAETLSFLKDGEVWIADKDASSPIAIIRLASKQLVVETWQKLGINQKERFGFSFVVDDYEPRRYYGGNSPLRSLGGGFYPEYDLGIYCVTRDGYESNPWGLDSFNYVDITNIDYSGPFNIISGSFQMRMTNVENEECQDTIYITDGRFDLEFDVQ